VLCCGVVVYMHACVWQVLLMIFRKDGKLELRHQVGYRCLLCAECARVRSDLAMYCWITSLLSYEVSNAIALWRTC
jgi:hypothetical protein